MIQLRNRGRLLVRHEEIVLANVAAPTRLLYASDLHLAAGRRHLMAELTEVVFEQQPDAVLLGGDLVDRRSGLPLLLELVERLRQRTTVLAVAGNHDAFLGADKVMDVVCQAGGVWLSNGASEQVSAVMVCGVLASAGSGLPRVLCGHDPSVFPRAMEAGFVLVLAGHLHGGQVVLWQRGQRLYPGACFYRYCGLSFSDPRGHMLVSRGMADTVPFRFRCPREVLLCTILAAD